MSVKWRSFVGLKNERSSIKAVDMLEHDSYYVCVFHFVMFDEFFGSSDLPDVDDAAVPHKPFQHFSVCLKSPRQK